MTSRWLVSKLGPVVTLWEGSVLVYLKRVEMFGFKSFADKTGVDFGHGVFAIVGPNGCGKSNIVDATRWVLGEQSPKSVRGSCMEDVIFNGNGHRGPHNFAEVTLTLDNESGKLPVAFTEVAVTRRVHRGGDCEYFINREPVRLKDVHNLFFDTGVSRNLYSLIGQGQVDRLASSAPQERRTLFEEAAGIMKYRTKKVIAVRNLDATTQDLARLNDILREREAQMESLKRQARKAERAKEVHDRLQVAVIAQLKADLAALREAGAQRRYQQGELVAREQALREQKELTVRELEGLRAQERELDIACERQRAEREELRNRVLVIEGDIRVAREQELALDRQQERLEEAARINAERTAALTQQRDVLQEQLAELRETLGASEAQLRGLRDRERDLARLAAEIDSGIAAAERRLREIEDDVRARAEEERLLRERLAQKQAAADEQAKRLARLQAQTDTIGSKGSELKQEYEQRHAARVEAEHAIAALREREQGVAAEEKACQESIRALESELATVKAELATQEKWLKNHEGCRAGVRALLDAAGRGDLPGLRGVLAEQLTISADYEMAIEAALGENLQTLLAEDEATAWQAVQLLHDGALGRATLAWPGLGAGLAGERLSPPPAGEGIDGPALALLGYQAQEKSALAVLLGRVCVVRDIAVARQLRAAGKGAGWDFVTRRGDYWQASGVLTAGPLESSQLLGRNRVISELKDDLRTKSEALRRLHDRRLELEQNRGALQGNRLRQQERVERLTYEEKSFAGELQAWEREAAGIRQEHGELTRRCAVSSEELRLLGEQIAALAAPDTALAQTQAEQEAAREQLAVRQQEVAAELERVRQMHIDQQVAVAGAREKSEALAREVNSIGRQLEGLAAEDARQRPEREGYAERKQALRTKVEGFDGQLAELHTAETASEAALREVVDRQQQVKATLAAQDGQLGEQQDLLEGLQAELHRIDREISDETHKESSLRQAVFIEFRMEQEAEIDTRLEACVAEPIPLEELDELRKTSVRLGGANFEAIEEYRELCERVEAMQRQRDDLTQAEANLRATIRRIDRYSREMFRRTFDAVNNNFKILARRLFEGGDAWLELTESEDLLQAGVEVFVRPPGKKLQAMALFSGGEKALISIALLFAVFLVKPSPFCILDEVDAPLDDANVQRFLGVVREFSKRTQFIMITHTKLTMMSADKLIGITMEERGVSRVLEVTIGEAQAMAS